MKQRPILDRSFPLFDIEISRSGDGRTVTAYAATFGDPYEVRDEHGHYFESINAAAFNRQISRGIQGVGVLYNHGRTIEGIPSADLQVPIGTPLEIKADKKGLLTVTRYNHTDLAERTLEAIRSDSLRFQSFRGPIYSTARDVMVRGVALPVRERLQLGLWEYGPAVIPVNYGAEMVGVRSVTDLLTIDPTELTDEERAALLAALTPATDLVPPPAPDGDVGTADGQTEPEKPDPALDPLILAQAQRRRRAA